MASISRLVAPGFSRASPLLLRILAKDQVIGAAGIIIQQQNRANAQSHSQFADDQDGWVANPALDGADA